MSNHNSTYQQLKTISVNRKALTDHIVTCEELSKNDLRVYLALLTELEGYSSSLNDPLSYSNKKNLSKYQDPKNFKRIDTRGIAELLNIKRKKVEESIEVLLDLEILEMGDSDTIRRGYRFTF